MVTQRAEKLPRPSSRELQLAIPALSASIEAELAEVGQSPAMSPSAPAATSFKEFEDRLWQLHVIRNRLRNTTALVDYGITMARAEKGRGRGAVESRDGDIANFEALAHRVEKMTRDAAKRSVAERMLRLDFALRVLRDSDNLKQRYYAAFVGDLDGRLLVESMRSQDGPTALDQLHIVEQRHAALVDAAGKDLVRKAELLFVGLHWWMRGRYGKGPEGHGLLKDPAAVRSPEAMFGLYMPLETPQPTDPQLTSSDRVPEIDRRHHYIWMYQYQTIQVSRESQSQSNTSRTGTRTKLSHFY